MTTVDSTLLQTAHQHYQSGRLREAETIYRQVVKQHPQQADIWFWLGLIASQLGKLEESVTHYQQVLQLTPNSAEAHSNLGTVLLDLGRRTEAIAHQQQAVSLLPNDANLHYNLAIALSKDEQLETAIVHYQHAVTLNPSYANAHHNLGAVLFKQNRLEEAIPYYQQAIALMPEHVNARNSLGIALLRLGELETAKEQFATAIAIKPDYASAHDNLGTVLQRQGELEAAIEHYRQAIALKPNCANAYSNLGAALKEQGKLTESIACYQEAIRLQPDHADAYNNYGGTLVEQGKFHEAIDCYEQAIHYRSDYADAHLNLGIILLTLGDFHRGFTEYHWRWQTKQCPDLRYPQALWDGDDLHGKVVLLTAEQGFGDTLQFVRYAPLVAQRGGHVVIACQKPLLRLLNTIGGIDRCVDRDRVDVQTHLHCPLLDLPLILGTTLETIPAQVPYFQVPPSRVKLPGNGQDAFKVGIAWAANPSSSTAGKRSCRLNDFLSLLELPQVVLYSLQKDCPEADRPLLTAQERMSDLSDQLQDFGDTAAAIAQLDLVISVDTAVAHLAGALGKPVWTLLSYVADWRWLLDRPDSPWYPTMRLFRQPQPGDWQTVFQHIMTALQQTIPTTPTPPTSASAPPPSPATSSLLSSPPSLTPQPCRHGTLLYYPSDRSIGQSLDLYGEYLEGEVTFLQPFLRSGHLVIEVGASLGAQTVWFAKAVGITGKVLAIEPQRLLFQTLCANLALNQVINVYPYQVAVGNQLGFTQISVPPTFRAGTTLPASEPVQMTTLDSFAVPQCCLLKINGQEAALSVLEGATATIQRSQPIVYISARYPQAPASHWKLPKDLRDALEKLGYDLYWHEVPWYQLNNFRQHPIPELNPIAGNLLGLPRQLGMTMAGVAGITALLPLE
ncbi:FkbM family methyltransferase [Pantanalinema sp. GBBB05]|uniref:FkbM family methyltransferase n=1 Tax=Pantanalinema sp. GBBB05 TaxID=2604139 RepID=UPI001D91C860|nr:FkbM family methyltransferase [Pantanalinema sp. GBBB05]